jgi:hypothetical protein
MSRSIIFSQIIIVLASSQALAELWTIPPPFTSSRSCLSPQGETENLANENASELKFPSAQVNDDDSSIDLAKATPLLRKIDIRVAPYGNIIIDGEVVGRDMTHLSTRLFPGKHQITVENPYGKTVSKTIYVHRTADNPALYIHLKPKPAQLTIESNVDADISVDGAPKGRSWTSELNPIVLPFEHDWRGHAQYDVVVSRDGYEPTVFRGTFRAGTTTVMKVVLKSVDNQSGRGQEPSQYRYKTTLENLDLPTGSSHANVRIR